MDGITMMITRGTTGVRAVMTGTIGDGMEILTATGVTHDHTAGIGIGIEINWRRITVNALSNKWSTTCKLSSVRG